MVALIIGGSGSGKSEFAEKLAARISDGHKKYYIATMEIFDEESEKKAERHIMARADVGFHTLETPRNVSAAAGTAAHTEDTALLECMSNLTANEMFAADGIKTCEYTAEKVLADIKELAGAFKNLVIVTNNVFEDGIDYDKTTMEYIRALGMINKGLAEFSDSVTEVVAGIPLALKGERLC